MSPVEVSKEAFEVALVLGGGLVVLFFELGVANEGFAIFAPILGLSRKCQYEACLGQ